MTARPEPRLSFGLKAAALCTLALLPGCAQPGPMTQRGALVGSLRDSVSHLESQKQKLERQVADLSRDNRRLENRLVDEEAHNRELSRRMNDGRLAQQDDDSAADDDIPRRASNPRRTIPAARPRERRTPFAQIPNQIQPLDEPEDSEPPKRPRRQNDDADSELFPSNRDDLSRNTPLDDRRTRWLWSARSRAEDTRTR